LVRGILLALRNDYESSYLESVVELIHKDLFADFLDMADYLLQQGYKSRLTISKQKGVTTINEITTAQEVAASRG
jgi:hypothetical protein